MEREEVKRTQELICLICGWRGTEEDRKKTFIEQTVMGGKVRTEEGKHFYEMGFRCGWGCGPVVPYIGQPDLHILCDDKRYNMRNNYYKIHPHSYIPDEKMVSC